MVDYHSTLDDFFVSPESCSPEELLSAFNSFTSVSGKLGVDDPLLFKDFLSGAGSRALFRRGDVAKDAETFAWLAQVQRSAEIIVAAAQVPPFNGFSIEQMKEIAKLSLDAAHLEHISTYLWKYGIVLAYLPQTAGMKTDGVFFKLSCGRPVIGMTLRYDRYDYFWFTLMHELAHITLHYDRLDSPHFDCIEDVNDEGDILELEANQVAKESFLSRSDWRTASVRRYPREDELFKNAAQLSVHPAILAGMVRYDQNNYALFSQIVHKISVRKVVTPDA